MIDDSRFNEYTGKDISRRGALCAAAVAAAGMMLPDRAFADDASNPASYIHSDYPAESFRFSNGEPIDVEPVDGGASFYSAFEKWGKNEAGQWINSIGDPIPGALLRGIDVSIFQHDIDWNAVKNDDVSFAIVRAAMWAGKDSKGKEGVDANWHKNASACERVGMPYGAYIYSYATSVDDAIEEADYLLSLVRGHRPTYPLYIDLEDKRIASADLNSIAIAFCRRVEAAGYRAGVYASLNWWRDKLADPRLNSWSRWVAQHNITCDYAGSVDMWQATDKGAIDGITGNVDVNFSFIDLESDSAGPIPWKRVYGQDQFDTMRKISQEGWDLSDTVVLATDANYWDALAASSVAGLYGCPILLTRKGQLSKQAADEIVRLKAKSAFVCGGPVAISSDVDRQIKNLGCSNVVRLYGQDQQGTAKVIAEYVRARSASDTCIVATAWKFHDALSASPFSYAKKAPIYLCRSGSNDLSSDVLSSIKKGGYSRVLIAGGPVAVSSRVEGQLASAGITNVVRCYGRTEYETSKAIAEWELGEGMSVSGMGLATGTTFYDALSGAALCGKDRSVLVIASDHNRVCITDCISSHRKEVVDGRVFGGPVAVSDATFKVLSRVYMR